MKIFAWIALFLITTILLTGCGQQSSAPSVAGPMPSFASEPTLTHAPVLPTPTLSPSPMIITATNTPTITPTITPTTEPDGCLRPSEKYDRISINGYQLNQRTFEMLAYAAQLYGGAIDITGSAITQGSYTSAVEASFGTHAGGGAVDLSVMAPGTFTIIEEDIEPLIRALRLAGFAAWYRDLDVLYDGSPVHIHAIAIGDRELSLAAREQLAGPHGYFWGYDGLPVSGDTPTRDPHGGPIVCDWMVEKGYPNKTATPSP
jgi:hypothetical protein